MLSRNLLLSRAGIRSFSSTPVFTFNSKGQKGTIPKVGLGTAVMDDADCSEAVSYALNNGYTLIDTAMIYGNEKGVGEGIKKSGKARDDFFVITKVGFLQPDATQADIFHPMDPFNIKGMEETGIDMCLEKLGLDYVDCLLVHTPLASNLEYITAGTPHFFEYMNITAPDPRFAVTTTHLPGNPPNGGENMRDFICEAKLRKQKILGFDYDRDYEIRKQTWKNMENILKSGKAKSIGVSNYTAKLLKEMESYAEFMPAVNELELHPRRACDEMVKTAAEMGI